MLAISPSGHIRLAGAKQQTKNSNLPEGAASAILNYRNTPAVQSVADERGRSSLPTTGIPIVAGASRTGSARTEPVTAVALSIVTGTSLLASCSESTSHEYGEQGYSPYSEGSDGLGHELRRTAEAAADQYSTKTRRLWLKPQPPGQRPFS